MRFQIHFELNAFVVFYQFEQFIHLRFTQGYMREIPTAKVQYTPAGAQAKSVYIGIQPGHIYRLA
ncbi:hypothetical protein A8A01_06795 [Ewingella americana]|nr:hypothetical protein A8A01_06795 [Ewingella americana]